MFIKRGNVRPTGDEKNTILQTPEGNPYKVSFMVAYVWEQLDGKSSVDDIVENVKTVGKIDNPELPGIVDEIITELKKVGLVEAQA